MMFQFEIQIVDNQIIKDPIPIYEIERFRIDQENLSGLPFIFFYLKKKETCYKLIKKTVSFLYISVDIYPINLLEHAPSY